MADTPNVGYILPRVKDLLDDYKKVDDCLAGQKRIKKRGRQYLPMPNSDDQSRENQERYNAYVDRAVFYNVTKRTYQGLLGTVFSRKPIVEVPALLKPMELDATGEGISLYQAMRASVGTTLAFSRGGLLADYPRVEGGATREQILTGEIRPKVRRYDPQAIINWRRVVRGSLSKLALVVLRETFVEEDDGFEEKKGVQYRVLYLEDNVYRGEIWRMQSSSTAGQSVEDMTAQPVGMPVLFDSFTPLDSAGNPFDFIPFEPIGAEDNDIEPDHPNMLDLAELNLAHYRNSADHEDSVFVVGQPTLVLTGLTQAWVEEVLKGRVLIGSRQGIPLPTGGAADMLQPDPNTLAKDAMEQKERQMVALGARLVEQRDVQRTAKEASMEHASENSVLANVAENNAAAWQRALEHAGRFVGASGKVKVELPTDYEITRMPPEAVKAVIGYWQQEALTFGEMRAILVKNGIATEDAEAALAAIQKERSAFDTGEDEGGEGGGRGNPDR